MRVVTQWFFSCSVCSPGYKRYKIEMVCDKYFEAKSLQCAVCFRQLAMDCAVVDYINEKE